MNKQFVAIVIVTFIVIIVWIIADILHAKPSIPLNPKFDTLLTPISPNFDQKVISQIKEVTPVDEIEVPEQPQPKPAASKPPVSSSSAIQEATTGGREQ